MKWCSYYSRLRLRWKSWRLMILRSVFIIIFYLERNKDRKCLPVLRPLLQFIYCYAAEAFREKDCWWWYKLSQFSFSLKLVIWIEIANEYTWMSECKSKRSIVLAFFCEYINIVCVVMYFLRIKCDFCCHQISYMISAWARMCKIFGTEFTQYLPLVMPSVMKAASIKPEVAVIDGLCQMYFNQFWNYLYKCNSRMQTIG